MEQKEAAWQRLDRVTAKRKNLLAAGYRVIPTNGKRPFLDGWEEINATDADIARWAREYPDALNTGIQTARTPGVDIDVYDETVAEELQEILWTMIGDNGQAIVRYGLRPKRLTLFQTDEPFSKIATPIFHPPGDDTVAHRVEVLCDGQQFIADGIHPDTGSPYVWEGGEPGAVSRDDLPYLSKGMATEFVAKAIEVFRRHGWVEKKPKKDRTKSNGSAVSGATNFDALYGGREQKWAAAALANLASELAGKSKGDRNERLYSAACRMGTMTVRKWIGRDTVIADLVSACRANGYTNDPEHSDPVDTINRGLDWGEGNPHEDLRDAPTGGGEAWRAGALSSGDGTAASPPSLHIVRADTVTQKQVEWLWQNRIARGKVTLSAGDPGVGKSQQAADIVARITKIGTWPDGGTAPPGSCIILSAEDAANDTICPRLDLAGADMTKVHIIQAVTEKGQQRGFNLQRDLEALAVKAAEFGDVALIVIDPITAYLGDKIDGNSTTDVRAVLSRLERFADEHGIAIWAITHPPKAAQSKAINAFTGSLAFVASARLAFVSIEEAETGRSLLLAVKNNLGPKAEGIGYRLVQGTTSRGIPTSRVEWDREPVIVTANEALATAGDDAKKGNQRREAKAFLEGYLEAQPMPAEKVIKAAAANDISERTLRRARQDLKIIVEREGYGADGQFMWRLP